MKHEIQARRDWREGGAGGPREVHPLSAFEDRLNSLLEEMWEKIGRQHHSVSGQALPGMAGDTDVSESAKDLRLEVDLPGMEEKDIEILADDDRLTIRAEKRVDREEKGRNYVLTERSLGRFSRSYRLPAYVEPEGAKASYRNGVLTVTIPTKAGAKARARKIPIKGT